MLGRRVTEDTIVAVATAPGEGGIGIVRLSGEKALAAADSMFRSRSGVRVSSQKNFTVRYGHIVEGDRVIDEGLVLVMRAPKSYTGEDTVEISAHGGMAVLEAVVRLALRGGARLAQPGEFTKRAFLNGRMDLLQAEAVLDLVRARTDRERGWAVSQLEGALSKKMRQWKETLIRLLSHLEAAVDFPEDEPSVEPMEETARRLEALLSELHRALKDSELAFVAKRGFSVVLWGKPNVGKSSLLNRLTRSERVIVTPYPGTTRDVVEETASISGFAVRFQDTAGMRKTDHPIEKEGVERSKKAMASAELVLLVLDSSRPLEKEDRDLFDDVSGKKVLVVLNKSDLPKRLELTPMSWPVVATSCVEEKGTNELEKKLLSLITGGRLEIPQEALVGTARQKDLLEKTSQELERALRACRDGLSAELVASDLLQALDCLGELVGEVFNDDILDTLFKQFCIGK